MLKAEVEAEELEKKAKAEMKNKNFENALSLFEDAKKIYVGLNFKGKIMYIEKQLAALRKVIEYEKSNGRPEVKVLKDDTAVKHSEAYSKKALEIKEGAVMNDRELSLAEIRRAKLRERIESGQNVDEREEIRTQTIEDREEQRRKERLEEEKKQKLREEEAEKKRILKEQADWALEQAKMAMKYEKFDEAKTHYKEAIENMKALGWFDHVGVLYDEIRNIENIKAERMRKSKEETLIKKRSEEEFQSRVDDVLTEKKKEEEKRLARLKALPPEIKQTLAKVMLLKEKAEKEERAKVIQRALGRYQYILELYKSIPTDKIDLTNEIAEIEKKIAKLGAKK